MSEAKYTPGPWTTYWRTPFSVIKDARGFALAEITHVGGIDGYPSWDTLDANARLIAAAPELLEALRAILREAENCWSSDSDCLRVARAAIAKAEGRKS